MRARGKLAHNGSLQRALGLCFGILGWSACGDRLTAGERALAMQSASAEERAQAEAELQQERAVEMAAIAAIENDRGQPPRLLDADELEGVLAFYCNECHALDRNEAAYKFETAEDLIALGRLIPGDAERSRVMIRIEAGEMPPPVIDYPPPVPPATVRLIADFIDSLPPQPSAD